MTRIQFSQNFSYKRINDLGLGYTIKEPYASGLCIDVSEKELDSILDQLDSFGFVREWKNGFWFVKDKIWNRYIS